MDYNGDAFGKAILWSLIIILVLVVIGLIVNEIRRT